MPVSRRKKPSAASDSEYDGDDGSLDSARPAKAARRSAAAGTKVRLDAAIAAAEPGWPRLPAQPGRRHGASYHRPQMLDDNTATTSLLEWFEGVSKDRQMPWRQEWIDPTAGSSGSVEQLLRVRAYQVWISEIMLQQTRVETVKSYWTSWMAKWPTIEALAAAQADEVLSAWRGLGYYSRATRIHTAAKKVVDDAHLQGMLPQLPEELEKQVPGVGRYTAGAISSIVFGHAVPILDGNVARVLSRQMALYANPKAKETTDLLWLAADLLVKHAVAAGSEGGGGKKVPDGIPARSRIPGQWNQALMELGSTMCTPKPNCQACPIRATCLAYAEGQDIALKESEMRVGFSVPSEIADIEDVCTLCEPIPSDEVDGESGEAMPANEAGATGKKTATGTTAAAQRRGLRQSMLNFGGARKTEGNGVKHAGSTKAPLTASQLERIEGHVKLFPMKAVKKQVRREECLVCVVRRPAGATSALASTSTSTSTTVRKARKASATATAGTSWEYLIEQRPDTGLLASMWQFPSLTTLVEDGEHKAETYPARQSKDVVRRFASTVLRRHAAAAAAAAAHPDDRNGAPRHVDKDDDDDDELEPDKSGADKTTTKNKNFGTGMHYRAPARWASEAEVEAESLGTGMRNCWALVQAHGSA
ncbi:uncharacterized protein PFL1_00745 [Pseudozyma flocculosa PF-1]|uniref:uncharacterized protein n=1 Tax=Pseudozyma flocculosa PF-1 TaxID=1277687 RepID=UPI0004561742|nr:uncharacterized protein PFL1_00745 [Pseudozyma flocculosa PF-1]EPQ31410.1 hypothetical protein PFL1_00745 [Pseudozyma flocculosa PF-1]